MTASGLLWILAIGALVFFIIRKKGGGGCCGTGSDETKDQHKLDGGCCGTGSDHSHGSTGTGKTVDPVCNMEVEPTESTLKSEHNGTVTYFCSPHCKEKFDADPYSFSKTEDSEHQPKGGGCCG